MINKQSGLLTLGISIGIGVTALLAAFLSKYEIVLESTDSKISDDEEIDDNDSSDEEAGYLDNYASKPDDSFILGQDKTKPLLHGNLDHPEADGLYTVWLLDYEGGLSWKDFEEALRPDFMYENYDEIKKSLENTKRRIYSTGEACFCYQESLTEDRSIYVSNVQILCHTRDFKLEVIYHFRNNSRMRRPIEWSQSFSEDVAFRDILTEGKTELMKYLAQQGIWV